MFLDLTGLLTYARNCFEELIKSFQWKSLIPSVFISKKYYVIKSLIKSLS